MEDVSVTGNMHVSSLKEQFKKSFGTELRIYKTLNTGRGARPAEEKSTLASIAADSKKIENLTIKKGDSVEKVEDQFKDILGIGIQVMLPDGNTFAPNNMKLKDVAKEIS